MNAFVIQGHLNGNVLIPGLNFNKNYFVKILFCYRIFSYKNRKKLQTLYMASSLLFGILRKGGRITPATTCTTLCLDVGHSSFKKAKSRSTRNLTHVKYLAGELFTLVSMEAVPEDEARFLLTVISNCFLSQAFQPPLVVLMINQ